MDNASQGDLFKGADQGTDQADPTPAEPKARKPVLNRTEKIIAARAIETGERVTAALAEQCLGDIARAIFEERVDTAKVQEWLSYDRAYLKARLDKAELGK